MTYAPAMPSPWWTLSANALLSKGWTIPAPAANRYLSQPQVTTSFAMPPLEFRQPCGWLDTASQQLRELGDLKPGWDDAAAQPITPSLIASAWNFLTSELVSSLEVPPDIVPTFGGRLLLEWHTTEVDLVIELDPESLGSFYFCDNETGDEVESAIVDRIDALGTAFTKLGVQI